MAQRYGKRIQPERNAKGPHGTGRVHVNNPRDWGMTAATDYWANFGDLTIVPSDSSDLDLYGWLTTAYSHLAGDLAGFIDPDDVGTTGGVNLATAGDYLRSPFIFGDHAHALLVEKLLGFAPTTLSFECYARFAVSTNNEEETGFGFVEAGAASPVVKAGEMAFISSDGTNFSLESGAAIAVSDSLDDTVPHLWKVVLSNATDATWYVDDVLQSTTLAVQANLSPLAFSMSTKAATGANDPVVSWVHIWYE